MDNEDARGHDASPIWQLQPQAAPAESGAYGHYALNLAELALSSGHTRLPVVNERKVMGLLHTKELLTFLPAGERDWRTLVRPTVSVGLEDPLLRVLRLLQTRAEAISRWSRGSMVPRSAL